MKLLAMRAAVILLYSGVAMAQVQGDRPDITQQPDIKIVSGNESKHARDADARHCLALKNDIQIIRCAEKYR